MDVCITGKPLKVPVDGNMDVMTAVRTKVMDNALLRGSDKTCTFEPSLQADTLPFCQWKAMAGERRPRLILHDSSPAGASNVVDHVYQGTNSQDLLSTSKKGSRVETKRSPNKSWTKAVNGHDLQHQIAWQNKEIANLKNADTKKSEEMKKQSEEMKKIRQENTKQREDLKKIQTMIFDLQSGSNKLHLRSLVNAVRDRLAADPNLRQRMVQKYDEAFVTFVEAPSTSVRYQGNDGVCSSARRGTNALLGQGNQEGAQRWEIRAQATAVRSVNRNPQTRQQLERCFLLIHERSAEAVTRDEANEVF